MSVLIKGMEIPDKCGHCRFATAFECQVTKNFITTFNVRQQDCPLVPVPPHGRLIDADELHKLFEDQWHYLQVLDWNENPTAEATQSGVNWCINTMHDDAPTIIEAEEGE